MRHQQLTRQFLQRLSGKALEGDNSIQTIRALNGVSFEVKNGDRLGIVGHNGAGKSSLLKVLAGIYSPTQGTIQTSGRIVSTLSNSLGMEPEATGYENIVIKGLLLGLTRSEIDRKIDEIARFTELGKYLYMPVRIYSTGMATRLAFATITAMDADVLIMDEMIGAGDASFVERAEERLNQFLDRSKSVVLASHSDHMIRKFCNRALLLEHGKLIADGDPESVLEIYKHRFIDAVGA